MKSYRQEIHIDVYTRLALTPITDQVRDVLAGSAISEGIVMVSAMKPTSSVFIGEEEGGLRSDVESWLSQMAPEKPFSAYLHSRIGERDTDAHLKSFLMGRGTLVAVTGGLLDLNPIDHIFYGEFHGPGRAIVLVKIIGE
jgi:secondary thiamine-phosphate synthase enzyme